MDTHKKDYCLPMHTVEHILNQSMIRMFGCGRSVNAHIEKKKSKCDYIMQHSPTDLQILALEQQVNEVIAQHLPIIIDFVSLHEAANQADLSKLPEEAVQGEFIRLIKVGDYDTCACIGLHVENTSEIGTFKILSHDFSDGRWRVRFKVL